jgi:nucleoside-diphosphate-sugar epimerase
MPEAGKGSTGMQARVVLVTGASGYLGSHVVDGLLSSPGVIHVIAADRVPSQFPVETLTLDLTDPGQRLALPWDRLDAIVHLAAHTTVACENDFAAACALNIDATVDLLRLAGEAGYARGRPLRFVFASSVAAVACGSHTVDETNASAVQSTYGFTKVVVEQHVSECTRLGFVEGVSLRLPVLLVRPGREGRTSAGFLSDMVCALSAGRPFTCPLPQDRRIPCASVQTAARALTDLALADADQLPATLLHLPALAVDGQQVVNALRTLGVTIEPDSVQAVVDEQVEALLQGWPEQVESRHKLWSSAHRDATLHSIVATYLQGRDPSPHSAPKVA